MEGITMATIFGIDGFVLDEAKQRCLDVIKEMAKNNNVTLVGDVIFSPPHDYTDKLFLMYAYSDVI